jgi:protoheme IX farnesyltransferase
MSSNNQATPEKMPRNAGTALAPQLTARLGDYLEITKPKVVLLLVFTAMVGMVLSVPGIVPLQETFFGLLGIGLAASSAAAINHVVDQHADAQMKRTQDRPLPKGNLTTAQCLMFAAAIGVAAMVILVAFVNVLTAVLTFLSLIGYACVYTMYLKRATPQNIVIGGVAGAMPPVLGWAAITGEVTAESLLLFLIVFIWTPPHFWALAIHRRDDYTILLFLVTIVPYLIHMSGLIYLAGSVTLGVWFLYHAVKIQSPHLDKQPIRMFVVSIQYLMGIFAALLIDHYLPFHL